jgi:hypothetical protein
LCQHNDKSENGGARALVVNQSLQRRHKLASALGLAALSLSVTALASEQELKGTVRKNETESRLKRPPDPPLAGKLEDAKTSTLKEPLKVNLDADAFDLDAANAAIKRQLLTARFADPFAKTGINNRQLYGKIEQMMARRQTTAVDGMEVRGRTRLQMALCPPGNAERHLAWQKLMEELQSQQWRDKWNNWEDRLESFLAGETARAGLSGKAVFHVRLVNGNLERIDAAPAGNGQLDPFTIRAEGSLRAAADAGLFTYPLGSQATEVHFLVIIGGQPR